MIAPLVHAAALTGVVLLFTLLPFLPGGYDPLAAPLSAMARMAGYAALPLVPVALAWLAARSGTSRR